MVVTAVSVVIGVLLLSLKRCRNLDIRCNNYFEHQANSLPSGFQSRAKPDRGPEFRPYGVLRRPMSEHSRLASPITPWRHKCLKNRPVRGLSPEPPQASAVCWPRNCSSAVSVMRRCSGHHECGASADLENCASCATLAVRPLSIYPGAPSLSTHLFDSRF